MNVIADELGQLREARPLPTWSIKAASSCSSGCPNTASQQPLRPGSSVLARQLLHGRKVDGDRDGGNDDGIIQRLPSSWQSCSSGDPHELTSTELVESLSPSPSETTTTGRADTQTLPQIQRRCGWPLAEIPGTSGILDFAASRLAFHRRYYYWS